MSRIDRTTGAFLTLALLMTANCPSYAGRGPHPAVARPRPGVHILKERRPNAVRAFNRPAVNNWGKIAFAGNQNSLRPTAQRFPRPNTLRQQAGGYNGIRTYGNGINAGSFRKGWEDAGNGIKQNFPSNPCSSINAGSFRKGWEDAGNGIKQNFPPNPCSNNGIKQSYPPSPCSSNGVKQNYPPNPCSSNGIKQSFPPSPCSTVGGRQEHHHNVVFQPNPPGTWGSVSHNLQNYLTSVTNQGGLYTGTGTQKPPKKMKIKGPSTIQLPHLIGS
jgi:hypothetical protein